MFQKLMAGTVLVSALFVAQVRADLVVVDEADHVYKTGTGGQTLYWYMDLQQTAAGTDAARDDQLAYAAALTLDVEGVGVLSDWHMATETEIEALFGQAVEVPVYSSKGKLLGIEITYPDAPVEDIFDAVVTTPAWLGIESLGHFYGRYDSPESSAGLEGSSTYGFNWDAVGKTPPDYTSHDYQGAWIVTAVPEPVTMSLLALGLAGLVARRRKRRA